MPWYEDDARASRILYCLEKMKPMPEKRYKSVASWLVECLKELDREVNDHLPDHTFSDFGGQTDETISSAMGKIQARIIWGWYQEYLKTGQWPPYDYPFIPLKYPLGQLAEDICEIFEAYHGLKSIEWDKGIDIQKLYPNIKNIVKAYLLKKGIKE